MSQQAVETYAVPLVRTFAVQQKVSPCQQPEKETLTTVDAGAGKVSTGKPRAPLVGKVFGCCWNPQRQLVRSKMAPNLCYSRHCPASSSFCSMSTQIRVAPILGLCHRSVQVPYSVLSAQKHLLPASYKTHPPPAVVAKLVFELGIAVEKHVVAKKRQRVVTAAPSAAV